MTNARDILNKLTWDKRFDICNYGVVFVHRGAPHDLKVIKASAIRKVEKSFFTLEEETMIPFHRIRAIRDLRSGEDVYTKEEGVPYPLQEIEGHEDLGAFQDKAHSKKQVDLKSNPGQAIRFGARLSFPEDEPSSFEERAKEGSDKLGMVELSFFHYSGIPEEHDRYESIIASAENVIGKTQLNVSSIHLPNVNILSHSRMRMTLDLFLSFCKQIDCRSIVVHPGSLDPTHISKADRDEAMSSLRKYLEESSGEFEESNVTLSIETYPEKNRVPSRATDIRNLLSGLSSVYGIAYDTSHTMGDTENVIQEIVHNIDRIEVFHFSNRCREERHMPVFSLRGELNFTRIVDAIGVSKFDGIVILEYQPKKYRNILERDLKILRDIVSRP